jgi:hypothetical protein
MKWHSGEDGEKSLSGQNFFGRISNRKNLDLQVKMNALATYVL